MPVVLRKADIVSAFAISLGLDIAIAKLCACKVEWGQENPCPVTQDTLQVHTFGWLDEDVQLVPLATQATSTTAEALKYLGVLFDYANDDSSSLTFSPCYARSLLSYTLKAVAKN